jgi:hypothetical protein
VAEEGRDTQTAGGPSRPPAAGTSNRYAMMPWIQAFAK